jgi:hypothetical protein
LRTVLDQFDSPHSADGKVTEEEFFSYFASLSANYDTDEGFISMIKSSWKMTNLRPPPRTVKKNPKGDVVNISMSGQTHGEIITWATDISGMEMEDSRRANIKGVSNSRFQNSGARQGLGHHGSSLNVFQMVPLEGAGLEGVPNEEWLQAGAVRLKRNPNHAAIASRSKDMLHWPGAAGKKESKQDVQEMLLKARESEERGLFPKGPKRVTVDDDIYNAGLTKGHLPPAAGMKHSGVGNGYSVAGDIRMQERVLSAEVLGFRDKNFNTPCPYGYDTPIESKEQLAAMRKSFPSPASSGGPSIGKIQPGQPKPENRGYGVGSPRPESKPATPGSALSLAAIAAAAGHKPSTGTTAFIGSGTNDKGKQVKSLSELMSEKEMIY